MTDEPSVAHAEWRALGTGVRLVVHRGEIERARHAVEGMLDEVDRAYSRFRDDSELAALNRAAGRPTRVGPLLARAIEGALRAARSTGGAVDPTVGRALRVIGYDRDFDLIRDVARPLELSVAPVPGWRAVRWDPATHTIRVPAGVELDLGSTGKALAAELAADGALAAELAADRALAAELAADRALAAALAADGAPGSMRLASGPGVLVSLGGDVATRGTPPEGGWRIRVAEDAAQRADADGEVIAIMGGAVATSTTTLRRWRSGSGVTVHHLVDPRTGLPARGPWRTATVVAPDCETANAASTAAIVLGRDAGPWLERAGLPARLVAVDGGIVRIGGWPDAHGTEATGDIYLSPPDDRRSLAARDRPPPGPAPLRQPENLEDARWPTR